MSWPLQPPRGPLAVLACGALALGVGSCIVPDTDIQPLEKINEHAVKFVEPVAATLRTDCNCTSSTARSCDPDEDPTTWNPTRCPQTSYINLPHLLSAEAYPFCSCPTGTRDSDPPLPGIELFVEDQDEQDDIYAALLLDVDPNDPNEDPTLKVRFTRLLNPSIPLPAPTRVAMIGQEDRLVRRVLIVDLQSDAFDPCNAGEAPLEPGWHELTVLATDRRWNTFQADDEGSTVFEEIGSPDFSAGASQDTTHFAFFCGAPDTSPCDTRCVDPNADG